MGVQRPVEIDPDDLVPESVVGCQEGGGAVPARVVDERPDWSDLRLDLFDRLFDRFVIADVKFIARHGARTSERLGLLCSVGLEIEDRDLATLFRKSQGQSAPDTLSAAGHHSDLVFQSAQIRLSSLNSKCRRYRRS